VLFEELDKNIISFSRFRKIFLKDEAMAHTIPQMQVGISASLYKFPVRLDRRAHVMRTRAGDY